MWVSAGAPDACHTMDLNESEYHFDIDAYLERLHMPTSPLIRSDALARVAVLPADHRPRDGCAARLLVTALAVDEGVRG